MKKIFVVERPNPVRKITLIFGGGGGGEDEKKSMYRSVAKLLSGQF